MSGPVRRLRAWWQSRLPRQDVLQLTHRNVYILPSGAGLMMAATLLVLLVASINYQLNLGYGLTFLLAGSALAAMHAGHANLRGLRLSLAPPTPQFAGTAALLDITVASDSRRPRTGIALAVLGDGPVRQWVWCDVQAQASTTVQVGFVPAHRGWQPLPSLTVATRFPLGTFQVWTVWRPAAKLLVYPRPEPGAPPLPPGQARRADAAPAPATQPAGGDFDGLRPWRPGDPLRALAWKKFARTGEPVSRDRSATAGRELWLDLAAAGPGDTEQRLSRLAAWVLRAEAGGLDYGLSLPGLRLAPARGEAHRRRCLEALALC